MQIANNHQKIKVEYPGWHLLAEYSVNDVAFAKDILADLTAGPLFQTMRDLSIPPECLKRIEVTMTEAARGAKGYFNCNLPDIPVRIRLFCHKKTMENPRDAEDQMNGGWGFYVIQRGKDIPNAPGQDRPREVELYLYKEGE